MAEENKSSLQKVIEELLARTKTNQSPMAQVNAQMSAKDPNFAAGALVGQLLSNYIGNYLQRGRARQTIQDTNQPSPSDAGLTAGQNYANSVAGNADWLGQGTPQQQTFGGSKEEALAKALPLPDMEKLLGNGGALQQAAAPVYDTAFGGGEPNAWRDILARLRGGI